MEHSVLQRAAEEQRPDVRRVCVVHIVQHPPQVPDALQLLRAGGKLAAHSELGGKLPAAEAGLVVELASLDAPLYNVLKFAGVVAGGGPLSHFKVGLNHIVYVPQQHGSPLLNVLRCTQVQFPGSSFHHGANAAGGNGGFNLVASQVGKMDGGADVNAVDVPAHSWMPIDRLNQSSGC